MDLLPLLMFFVEWFLFSFCNFLFIIQVLSEGEQHTLASTPAHPAGLYGMFFFQDHLDCSTCVTVYCISYSHMLQISWKNKDPCYG